MARLKGSKNKKSSSETRPFTSNLSTEERIRFLANIIVDRIIEDQNKGRILFNGSGSKNLDLK